MRWRMMGRWLGAVMLVLGFAGCIKQKTLVVVEPDGSGHIAVSRALAGQAGSAMEAGYRMSMRRGGGPTDGDESFFKEKLFKLEGRLFGKGVKFVKAQRTRIGSSEGAVAIYTFKDISQVRIPLDVQGGAMMYGMAGADLDEMDEADLDDMPFDMEMPNTILFSFDKGDKSTLKITMPPAVEQIAKDDSASVAAESAGGEADESADESDEEADEWESPFGGARGQLEAMKTMWRGARFTVQIKPRGTVLKSNASHRAPDKTQRVVLLDADFDRAMGSPNFAALARQPEVMSGMPGSGLDRMLALPGIVAETNRHVEIEFK